MKNSDQYPNADKQIMLRDAAQQQHLPSTEVRELVPDYEDEIDLRDLLDVLLRRKWTVITCLLVCFFTAVLVTFSMTPQFKASGSIKVSAQAGNLTNFENVDASALKTMEFQQTQVKMLQSEQLANRVIERLELASHKVFNPALEARPGEAQASGLMDTLKGFIRADEQGDEIDLLSEEAKEQMLQNSMLSRFKEQFGVTPVKNSELIEVSFASPDPELSSAIVNSAMDAFLDMHMDGNLKASRDSGKFLEKQIHAAQVKLEKSEQDLQAFARKIGIVSLDPKTNLTFRQMEEFNEALAKARADRVAKEARYNQNTGPEGGEVTQIMDNKLIQDLKSQYATLKGEYENLGTTFKADYPQMRQLKARMDDIEARIATEKRGI
ncbi:MAG: hypothetical protein EOM24_31300, partial [Chloroflexia bacterium]|nr:hypothetical protein [Chloroflexia bacterium]